MCVSLKASNFNVAVNSRIKQQQQHHCKNLGNFSFDSEIESKNFFAFSTTKKER
jgi:hypothetical protein